MDIAAMSIVLSQARVQQEAGISVMKLAMDSGKASSEGMTQLMTDMTKAMEQSVNPHLGGNIDLSL